MSDDKKRDRALQRRVRERQAKTGESYQAAWRQLTDQPIKPEEEPFPRVATGLPPLDNILGGGLVPASVVLLVGPPCAGKTSLTLQMLAGLGHPCLYVTTEETRDAVAATAERLGTASDRVYVSAERNLAKILAHAQELRVQTVAIDTIQKIFCEDINGESGNPKQLVTSVDRVVQFAKTADTAFWLVGHVTNDGDIAGSRSIEHSVDVVLELGCGENFDGAERIMRCRGKNRFGSTAAVGRFTLTPEGAWRQLTKDPSTPDVQTPEEDEVVFTSGRMMIPLHLPLVPPHQPTRVTGRTTHAVDVERLYITGAGTSGGAADWIVNDVEIDGRSQLAHKDLPGSLFGGGGKVTAGFNGFDPVERKQELTLVVTYIGQNPEGCPLYASVVGIKPAQRPTIVPIASSEPLLPLTKTTIRVRLQSETFQINRVTIQHGDTYGGAADWIVNDVRIGRTSQFVQSGDIPGDMFATNAIDTFVKIETCKPDIPFEIDVTYIGLNERGEIFDARLEGTVLRDNYSVAPPDLHAVVETVGKAPGIQVVGTCNWRAPASDNRTR